MNRTSLWEMTDKIVGTKIEMVVRLNRILRDVRASLAKPFDLVNPWYMPTRVKGRAVIRSSGYPCDR